METFRRVCCLHLPIVLSSPFRYLRSLSRLRRPRQLLFRVARLLFVVVGGGGGGGGIVIILLTTSVWLHQCRDVHTCDTCSHALGIIDIILFRIFEHVRTNVSHAAATEISLPLDAHIISYSYM